MSRFRPAGLTVGAVTAGALLLGGCTGGSAPAAAATPAATAAATPTATVFDDASVTVAALGKVPIPTPGPTGVQPLATRAHLQLVAMGDTVVAQPSSSSELGILAIGPDLTIAPGPATASGKAPGTITVTVRATRGSVSLRPADFVARDEYTRVTKLHTTARPTVVRAGQTRSITFSGTFVDGGAVFEWMPGGHRMVVWDFHVEID